MNPSLENQAAAEDNGGNGSQMITNMLAKLGEDEGEFRKQVDGIWGKIQNLPDPLTCAYWKMIDQPWRHPTAEEILGHLAICHELCQLVVEERKRTTGRAPAVSGLNKMFSMLTGSRRPNKVVRAAMMSALYIREEADAENAEP